MQGQRLDPQWQISLPLALLTPSLMQNEVSSHE